MTVAVLLNLPDDVYRALFATATKHETQVHRLIEISVTKSVRRVGKRSRLTAEQLATIRELNAKGQSDAAIAKRIGVSQSTVTKRRGDMGLEPPKPRVGGRQKAVQP